MGCRLYSWPAASEAHHVAGTEDTCVASTRGDGPADGSDTSDFSTVVSSYVGTVH